jgi:hypothetical protein
VFFGVNELNSCFNKSNFWSSCFNNNISKRSRNCKRCWTQVTSCSGRHSKQTNIITFVIYVYIYNVVIIELAKSMYWCRRRSTQAKSRVSSSRSTRVDRSPFALSRNVPSHVTRPPGLAPLLAGKRYISMDCVYSHLCACDIFSCVNHPTWSKNPQILLKLSGDGEATVHYLLVVTIVEIDWFLCIVLGRFGSTCQWQWRTNFCRLSGIKTADQLNIFSIALVYNIW